MGRCGGEAEDRNGREFCVREYRGREAEIGVRFVGQKIIREGWQC